MKSFLTRQPGFAGRLILVGAFVMSTPALGQRSPPALELVGVTIGMTQAQAEAVIRKRGLNVQVGEGSFYENNSRFPAYINGQTAPGDNSKPKELIRAFLAPPPSEPTVIAVSRAVSYGHQAGPEPATLISAMTEKYGKAAGSGGTSSDQTLYWSWDDKGITHPPDRRNNCRTMLSWFSPQASMSGGPSGTAPTPPDIFAPAVSVGCHRGILARVMGSVRASSYSSVVGDFVLLDAAIRRTAEHRVAIRESVNDKARKDAAKVKPEL